MPDVYLCNVSVVFGPIVSLDEVGTLYRVHGKNSFHGSISSTNVAPVRTVLLALADSHARQKELFNALYSADVPEIGSRDLGLLTHRMISLKLDPSNHPVEGDSLVSLCGRACKLLLTMPDPTLRKHSRILKSLWFLAMLLVPESVAGPLAEMLYFPEKRWRWWSDKVHPILRRVGGETEHRLGSGTDC
jgi:hypothetical protein